MKNQHTAGKESIELKIYKNTVLCGFLRRRGDGGAEFTYDPSYLLNSEVKNLCFNMKKKKESFVQHGVNLHPYFAGLLPEGLRLKYLLQKVKTSPDDLFSLFASIGADCIGDVYAGSNNEMVSRNTSATFSPRLAPPTRCLRCPCPGAPSRFQRDSWWPR
jgi:HipA-like protein